MRNRENDRLENEREPKDRPNTAENAESVTDQKDEQEQKETD